MSAVSLILAVFVGVMFGIVITALMVMARDRNSEVAGAGKLADTVMEVIERWEALGWDGVKPTRYECIDALYHIKMHAQNAQIAADEQDEKNYASDSTNG